MCDEVSPEGISNDSAGVTEGSRTPDNWSHKRTSRAIFLEKVDESQGTEEPPKAASGTDSGPRGQNLRSALRVIRAAHAAVYGGRTAEARVATEEV